jgi:hypothetical protein
MKESARYLGKVPLTQTKPNNKVIIFKALKPPRKYIAAIADNIDKFAYSAIKNKANPKEEYSTLKPATNSASVFYF